MCEPPVHKYRIRKAESRDIPRILSLAVREGLNPILGPVDRFLVYEHTAPEDGHRVIGCGQVRKGDPAELSTLVVDAAWRGRGIGSTIVGQLVDLYGKEQRIVLLTLSRTKEFYEPHGFVQVKEDDVVKLPLAMRIEFRLGIIVAGIVAPDTQLIFMERNPR